MTAALLVLALLAQGERRPPAADPLLEAQRLGDLALFDRAETLLRGALKAAPSDPQIQRIVPELRAALGDVLLAARKYEETKIEGQAMRSNPRTRPFGFALIASAAWHAGQIDEARAACDEGDKAAADASPADAAEAVRRLKTTRALLGWKRFESASHIVHHPPDSPVAADPAAFGRRLDIAFDRVRMELGVEFEGKIEGFFFNDQAQADEIVARPLAYARPAFRMYGTRADGPPGFAIAQVVSFFAANKREKRPPRLPGLREGYASAHADDARWEGRRDAIPKRLEKEPDLAALLAQPADDAESFALTGSFVRWLIRTRGRDLFRRLWTEYNDLAGPENAPAPGKPWLEIYGYPLKDLETAWLSSIK